ncbi:MAG: RcpC/CpaB family pilus assembly protein [bacterium]|nr:RcpC/CpaB family pilus assembly protein [bacterium]
MNNLSLKIRKLFSNKNFVTAFCFILIGVVLIIGYKYRINEATNPVRVPYALTTISPQTEITADMIGIMSIARDAVNEDIVYTSANEVLGKYVNLESTVYAGSLFYKNAVVDKSSLASSVLLDIPDGQTLLTLKVDMKSSYYNSLVPGDYFDLYVRTIGILPDDRSSEDEILVGKLIDKIKILAVKTENGQNVFGGTEARTPAGVLFAVPEDQALLLMKADYFSRLSNVDDIEFVIIPRGEKYKSSTGETITSNITSEQLEKYIKDKTKDIDTKSIKENTELGG